MLRFGSRGLATASNGVPLALIRSSLILSRTPIVTPDVSEFDQKFYHYQEELERRLMWTFPKWYYFKKGTVAEKEFSNAQDYPMPSHPGVWFPEGVPDIKHGRDRRFKQEVILPKKETEGNNESLDNISRPIAPNSRVTEADKANDQTSLERKLPRTLYLMVKHNGKWKFPAFGIADEETSLSEAAEAGLRGLGGDNINTWTVSGTPAAVIKYADGKIVQESSEGVLREYLIKSHIIAGSFKPTECEYKWLVREEVGELVEEDYFSQVDHLLARV